MAKNSKQKLRNRAVTVIILTILVGFGIGVIGLVSVGLIHGSANRQKAESELISDNIIKARRGTIYDRNMKVLAQSANAWKIYVNPSQVESDAEAESIAKDLSKHLDAKYSEILRALKKEKYSYVIVGTKIGNDDKEAIDKLRKEKKGYNQVIGIEEDVTRYYPYNNFASTIIGFTGSDDSGRSGLEYYYNDTLAGVAGRSVGSANAVQQEFESNENTYYAAKQGTSLKLTIDDAIQYYLDSSLSKAVKTLDASYGYGIVMDTKTGAILAMSSQPDYNLNEPYKVADEAKQKEIDETAGSKKKAQAESDALFQQWRNRTITDTYEPGSVFKCVTAAAGIEEGVVSPDEMFTCTGSYQVEDRTYHCSNRAGHGRETFTTSLANSCNPIYIQVAQRLGAKTFSKYFEAFGMSEVTGIDLPAEASPKADVTYHSLDHMGAVQLASSSFGQTFQISPIQMITAINAIANDGKLMQPYIVDKYIDSDGNVIKQTQPVEKRQAISKITADVVSAMMEDVVLEGTASNAYVPGYKVAGKTGTSEKLTAGENVYIGGKTAAPVSAEVIENTLKYLNVEPEYTDEEKADRDTKMANEVGVDAKSAKKQLEKLEFTVEIVGNGDRVTSQMPAAGKLVPADGYVVLYTGNAKAEKTQVPSLIGLTPAQARATGINSGINIEIVGDSSNTTSYQQSAAAGTEIAKGSTVTVSYMSANDSEMNIEDTGNAD